MDIAHFSVGVLTVVSVFGCSVLLSSTTKSKLKLSLSFLSDFLISETVEALFFFFCAGLLLGDKIIGEVLLPHVDESSITAKLFAV